MKKRWFLVGMIFLLLPWLLVGCGVAQEQYDVVVADLNKAQQELQSVRAAKTSLESEVNSLTSKLSEAENTNNRLTSEISEVNAEKTNLESEVSNLTSQLSEAEAAKTSLKQDVGRLKAEVLSLESRIPTLVYRTHLDKANGFSIDYPDTWQKKEVEEALAFYVAPDMSNLLVGSDEMPELMSVQNLFDVAKQGVLAEGHEIIGFKEITVSGLPAIKSIFIKENVIQMFVVLVKGKVSWTIVYTVGADSFVDYAHTFNEITDSFKLL